MKEKKIVEIFTCFVCGKMIHTPILGKKTDIYCACLSPTIKHLLLPNQDTLDDVKPESSAELLY